MIGENVQQPNKIGPTSIWTTLKPIKKFSVCPNKTPHRDLDSTVPTTPWNHLSLTLMTSLIKLLLPHWIDSSWPTLQPPTKHYSPKNFPRKTPPKLPNSKDDSKPKAPVTPPVEDPPITSSCLPRAYLPTASSCPHHVHQSAL
jgi:hypothetical protein